VLARGRHVAQALAVVVVRCRHQHGIDLWEREQLAVVGDAHDATVGALLAQRLAPCL